MDAHRLTRQPRAGALDPRERDTLPSGRELVAEGVAAGAVTPIGVTAFCRARGVGSEAAYKRDMAADGEITWSMIMGLATLDDQVRALGQMDADCREAGIRIDRGLVIPSPLSGLPPEARDAPKTTSFILDGLEAHQAIAQAAPIQPCFNDFHIGSPAAFATTLQAVRAGGSYHGVFAQFLWTLPGWTDEIGALAENVKAVGVVAAKRDDLLVVDSYLDDGAPSHFADYVSWIGYALLERHIVDTLCGARYATGFGQLLLHLPTKLAVWLALDEVLRTDIPGLSYLYGNAMDQSGDLPVMNHALTAGEVIAEVATERRFGTGVSILPCPVYEKVRIPNQREIFETRAVAEMAASRADEWAELLSFDEILATKDVLVREGRRWLDGALAGMRELGYDTNDPLQVMLAARRVGPVALELLAHPASDGARLTPFLPTVLTRKAQAVQDEQVAAVAARGLRDALRGLRIVAGSTDTHSIGLGVVRAVLDAAGAEVIDAGVDLNPPDFVRVAIEHSADAIAISTHNGQCLDFARQVMRIQAQEGSGQPVFMGGKLNGYLDDGDAEPRDLTRELADLGVTPCAAVVEMVEGAARVRR